MHFPANSAEALRTYLRGMADQHIDDLVDARAILAGLTKLTTLDLGDNVITDLTPLADLPALRHLALDQNPIADWTPVAHITRVYGRPDA